jgi:hypothetical protein
MMTITDSDKQSWIAHLRTLYKYFVVQQCPKNARSNGVCVYAPLENLNDSVGCAVGCLLSEDLAEKLDDETFGSIWTGRDECPDLMNKILNELNLSNCPSNIDHLAHLQTSHDEGDKTKPTHENMELQIKCICRDLNIDFINEIANVA